MAHRVVWYFSGHDRFGHIDPKCPNRLMNIYAINKFTIEETTYEKCPNCWDK